MWDMHGKLHKDGIAQLWALDVQQLLPWLVAPTPICIVNFFVNYSLEFHFSWSYLEYIWYNVLDTKLQERAVSVLPFLSRQPEES